MAGEQRAADAEQAQSVKQPGGKGQVLKPSLRTGQRVVLQGLEKAKELNGHRGVVVRWQEDAGRYAVRVAGKEMAIRPENLKPEGGAAEAARLAKKFANTEGSMINPVVYARVPGAGPKMTQWIGQVKAGRRIVVRAEQCAGAEEPPVPLWFGDQGFVNTAPVDVALLIGDIGDSPDDKWPKALAKVLERFPAAGGRLRCLRRGTSLQVWQILVNNAGVPFTTATVPPCGLPSPEALQLACSDDQSGFFDLGGDFGSEDEPLLRLKLVYEEGTARGILGVSFHHALCDISGIASILRWLHAELENERPPDTQPCHNRRLAQETFNSVGDATPEEDEHFSTSWPQWPRALERWCFLARRLRSGLRGRPDGVATVAFTVPAATLTELKAEAEATGATTASTFEALVGYLGLKLLSIGRRGRRALVTKDYRASLEEAAPNQGLDQLFANVVTHGLSFELPTLDECESLPLGEACAAMRLAIDMVSLGYVRWHSKQDHFKGLPNLFGGLCCNTWGRSLADLSFVEAYAVGMRSIDERANNMSFPLDTAYLQVFPQPNSSYRAMLTMPVTDITNLLKELPESHFELPHVSELRAHAFRVPLPSKVIDQLNPTVETHHLFARVACVGDSMTACGYPKYLQALFDKAEIRVQVRNFGAVGATAQRFSDQPYWDERKFEEARQWRPHFLVITLGTNDAKSSNWDAETFTKDLKELCLEFLERQAPRPRVFLAVPPPLYTDGQFDIVQDVVNGELPQLIPQIATAAAAAINAPLEEQAKKYRQPVPAEMIAHTDVVDAFYHLGGAELRRRAYFAEDGVHLNERGTRLLATLVFSEMRRHVSLVLKKMADAASVVPDSGLGL